jgi:uncharacterized protein (TIGR02145 family)
MSVSNSISTAAGTTSGTVTATTDIEATCKWSLGADFTYATGGTAFTTTGGTSHSTTVTGLSGGSNTIYVRCANSTDATKISTASTTSVSISTAPPVGTTGSDMQTITASTCPTTRTRVVDARDNATYWVRKIGSLCWMETNLAYAGGGDNTYGDATPAIPQGSTSAHYTYTAPYYYVPPGSNRTTGTTDPSTSTNGTGQYGYLYNWCAALNGQSAACQGSAATQPNQSVNGGTSSTQYNICPANWRLPTGNNGEMLAMANANGWTSGAPTPLFTNGLYMFSGLWGNGSFYFQGSDGSYWSSTVGSATSAYTLNFLSSNVYPANYSNKQGGSAVRCVAP